ncbi:MAG: hypothetical protein VZR02_05355 [Lachnospiraceae bacterium]|nr:hypothetical protein [Lachnospiraceae bacterium]
MSYYINMFKQAVRGFDKDEVLQYLEKQDDEKQAMIEKYERELDHRNKVINDLKNRIVMKDEQLDRLEDTIRTKYQKYIDNYQQIGELVFDSRMKADQILADAKEKADKIIADAEAEAKSRVSNVREDVAAEIRHGSDQYDEIRLRMDEIVDSFNKMQKKFMQSYKEIHEITDSLPDHLEDTIDAGDYDENESDMDDFEDDEEDDELDLGGVGMALDDGDFELDEEDETDASDENDPGDDSPVS